MRWLGVLLLHACLSQASTFVIAAGVEQYDDPQVSRLTYAVADARSVASAFRASGVPPKNVIVLTSDVKDASKRPTRINLLRAFAQVKQQATADDKLVFFFAGHGVERNGEQYLLGSDTQRDLLEETALPMAVVNKALDGLACGEVLFVIDACRNDPKAGRGDADAELSEEFARGLRPRIGGPTAKPRLVATLLACDAGQRAWESPEDGHGAFSMYLVKALSGQAAGENGQVTLSSLADYVGREVASWASRSKREQRPRLISPDGGDMVILTAPPEPVVSVAFQNHTLAQVVDLLAEQFSAQIVLGPGAGAALTVTGRLDNQPLGTVLKVLVAAHGLTVRREGKIYVLEGKARPAELAAGDGAPVQDPASPSTVALGTRPADWPAFLSDFQPPAGMTWASFRVRERDSMPQVLVPAGEFAVGSRDGEGFPNEHPQRQVYVSAFWMDIHDVTVGQFRRFCAETGHEFPVDTPEWGWQDRHPMVNLSLADIAAYTKWVGGRLPSEAQWEKAARGGLEGRKYPWGDASPAGRAQINAKSTSPVGSFAPNGFGLLDMAGNVWQWCMDDFDEGWYARMPQSDPVNATGADDRVIRGGCWADFNHDYVRVAFRGKWTPAYRLFSGFRCVQSADLTGRERQVERPDGAATLASSSTPAGSVGVGKEPANWPAYLAGFQPPAGMTWSSFRVRDKDGMPQVLLQPGPFEMGSRPGVGGNDERPARQIRLSGYWMDLHEVTCAQYCAFLNDVTPTTEQLGSWTNLREWLRNDEYANKYLPPSIDRVGDRYAPVPGSEGHPAIWISWAGACAYASWAGAALPTEAQWERAARGGVDGQQYFWGSRPSPPSGCANLADATALARRSAVLKSEFRAFEDGFAATAPVASFPPNAFGLFDLEGNVMEWCRDAYDQSWYSRMPQVDPVDEPAVAKSRVIRGGSWAAGETYWVRPGARMGADPGARNWSFGLRCVQPADSP